MSRLSERVQLQTRSSEPLIFGDLTLIPQAQALVIRWPNGGWVWNRPVAVLAERNGQVERIPIRNVTRLVQLGLVAFAIGFLWLTWIRARRERK
jgi:hypothetical protein